MLQLVWLPPTAPAVFQWMGQTATPQVSPPAPLPQLAAIVGPPGSAGNAQYVHTQSVPSTSWTINHGLGFYPTVTLMTDGGVEFEGCVLNVSLNQVLVQLNQPQTGRAILK